MRAIIASLFLCIATGCLLAQATPASSPDPSTTPDSNGAHPTVRSTADSSVLFPSSKPGTWDFSVWASQAVGNSAYGDVGDEYVSMAGFRTGYVFARPVENGAFRGTLEYFFDVIPVFVLTKPKVIYGGGFSPIGFKWNFIGGRRHPFVETSVGGIFSTRNVPPGDTSNFNFTVTVRGGLALVSRPRNAVTASAGFWHLSNAHMGDTNPSLNAFTFGVEYHWFKVK